MCIVFFKIPQNKESKLFIAFNREENYLRPTLELDYWKEDPNIIGGRDAWKMGTWFGLNKKTGNVAFLTNLEYTRNGLILAQANKWSRGDLVRIFISSDFYEVFPDIQSFYDKIIHTAQFYNPCNLICGNLKSRIFKNIDFVHAKITTLTNDSIHGFSNNHFNHLKWSKVERGLQLISQQKEINSQSLLKVMTSDIYDKKQNHQADEPIFITPRFERLYLRMTMSTTILQVENNNINIIENTYLLPEVQAIKSLYIGQNKRRLMIKIVNLMIHMIKKKNWKIIQTQKELNDVMDEQEIIYYFG